MKRILLFAAIMLAFAAGCSSNNGESDKGAQSSEVETISLIANSAWPEDNFMTEGLIELSEKVNEYTNGQVEIDVKPNGELGYEGTELLGAVRDNLVPITDMLAFNAEGDEPLFGLSTLPFLVKDFDENRTINDIARSHYEKAAEEKWNQKILYVATWPGAGFWTKEKINSIDDFKGLKVRTADGNGANVVQKIGGVPHQLAFAEVYSSLATGVIDSVLTSTPTAVDGKFWEVLDYYLPANVTMGVSFVTMNLDEFNKLDAEAQEAIIKAGQEIEEELWQKVIDAEEENEKLVEENGIEIIQLEDELLEELSTLTAELREEWLENAPEEAREIVEEFYKEIE